MSAVLTKEGTTVEADGGLACHLSPIKNCIVELVRKGQGLWSTELAVSWNECRGLPSSNDIARVFRAGPGCPPTWGFQSKKHEVLVALGHSTLVRDRVSALELAEALNDGPQCRDSSS